MLKAGTQEVCPRVWEKASGMYRERERDDSTTSTRLAIDPTTARKSRKRLGKNWPSRPPIVARQTRQQWRQFCCVYFTGVTTLCDEVPRWLPANQRGGSSPGWESPAHCSREASLIPNYRRINATTECCRSIIGGYKMYWFCGWVSLVCDCRRRVLVADQGG